MAFRNPKYAASMAGHLRKTSKFATLASPKTMNPQPQAPVAKTAEDGAGLRKLRKGELVPVGMAIGMIALSLSFGLHTAAHQLRRCPNVFVTKSKRESLPEVVEPEKVAAEADQFIKKSLFRKVAHLKDLRESKIN